MSLKAVFFDVGGTLLLADQEQTLGPLLVRGVCPTRAELAVAEKAAKSELDSQLMRQGKISVDSGYWHNYYTALLQNLRLQDDELKSELVLRTRTSANWSCLADGAEIVLQELGRKYRLGIISNSDGGISELLRRLGILKLFVSVTDSGLVGHEKPDARIFLAAVQSLGITPQEAVYVGDIYTVDYLGAAAVGMKAILMDSAGVYRDRDVERIESLRQLPAKLSG